MSFFTPQEDKSADIMPYQRMRGYTNGVSGVVHLLSERRIITCSRDGALRLWDLESGIQIGDDWRDGADEADMLTIALSPNGSTVASGSEDGTVRLWDVETGKVSIKWTEHTKRVSSVCWSAGGDRVMSASWDGTVSVWDVKSDNTVLGPIKTGHDRVAAAIYSPDLTKIATGGVYSEDGVKIWDAQTGELLTTIKHKDRVVSLAWTSNGKILASGLNGPIRIFNIATWQQIRAIDSKGVIVVLSRSDRLLASVSGQTARLWNLDTDIPVGPPLLHEYDVGHAALSTDGTVLVTGGDKNVYAWDVHAILKKAGLEDLLTIPNVAAETSSTDAGHMQRSAQLEDTHPPPQGYISDDTPGSVHSSAMRHHSNGGETPRLQQPSRQNSISHHGRSLVGVAAVQDKGALCVAPRPRPQHAQTTSTPKPPHPTTTSSAATAQLRPIIINKHTRWTRFWLFFCCPSAQYVDS